MSDESKDLDPKTVDHDETARAMVGRVKAAFEDGYTSSVIVMYEQNAVAGFSADEVFFGTMIYKSVLANLVNGNLPANEPEPPPGTKHAAKKHGQAAYVMQSTGNLKLGTILRSFYEIKPEVCPPPGGPGLLGFVCDL